MPSFVRSLIIWRSNCAKHANMFIMSSPTPDFVSICSVKPSKLAPGRWDRPELHKALDSLGPGDTFVVWKLDRLSRSLSDLLHLLAQIKNAGFAARLVFLVNSCATLSLNCADLSRGILFISANSSITNLHTKYIGAATGE
jgi:hypothetical protein